MQDFVILVGAVLGVAVLFKISELSRAPGKIAILQDAIQDLHRRVSILEGDSHTHE